MQSAMRVAYAHRICTDIQTDKQTYRVVKLVGNLSLSYARENWQKKQENR
jgi:hypothetical protein